MEEKLISVLKGAGLAAIGAVSVWLVQWSDTVDFGHYDLLVAALVSTVANLVRKLSAKE